MRSVARIAGVLALGVMAVLGSSAGGVQAAPTASADCPDVAGQVVSRLSSVLPSQVAAQATAQAAATAQAVCSANQNWD